MKKIETSKTKTNKTSDFFLKTYNKKKCLKVDFKELKSAKNKIKKQEVLFFHLLVFINTFWKVK